MTGSLQYPRRYPNATVLPEGKVLATGGSSGQNDASVAVLPAEMWDPATGSWTTMASMQVPRLYHSSAVLLPDNIGQRFVRPTFSAGSDGLTVTAPASGRIAPPGHYLLHAVDDDGVPSVGAIVQVG